MNRDEHDTCGSVRVDYIVHDMIVLVQSSAQLSSLDGQSRRSTTRHIFYYDRRPLTHKIICTRLAIVCTCMRAHTTTRELGSRSATRRIHKTCVGVKSALHEWEV